MLQVPAAVIAGVIALGIGTALGAVVAPAEDRPQPFPTLLVAPTTEPATTTSTATTSTTLAPATTTTSRAVSVTSTVAVVTTKAAAPSTTTAGGNCSIAYPTVCIPPAPPDLDCGDIPYRRFTVLPPDPHRFDGTDNDGIGCESG